MKRIAVGLLVAGLLIQFIGFFWVGAQFVGSQNQTSVPSEMVWYSGILRRIDGSHRWGFVHDVTSDGGGHTLVGFASVKCESGILYVRAPFSAVAGAVVQADETFAKREIVAGPSIGNDVMRIYMYRRGVKVSCSSSLTWGRTANLWVSMYVRQEVAS